MVWGVGPYVPQLQDISVAPDVDPQKKNLIIYDMNLGTKFTLTAAMREHNICDEAFSEGPTLHAIQQAM